MIMITLLTVVMLQLLQQIAKPHVDSFNYMLSTGLSDAVKACCSVAAYLLYAVISCAVISNISHESFHPYLVKFK